MPQRTITLDDTHDETLEGARADLRSWFAKQCAENPDMDLDGLEPHDQMHEIADSATPIHTREVETWHFLYGTKLRQAYQGAGIGDGSEDSYLQACIYCYIDQVLWECWRDLCAEEMARREDNENA